MSQNKFTIRKVYICSAINKAGERVYYATDPTSGGYPFWIAHSQIAEEWLSLDKVPVIGPEDYMDYMRNTVTKIEILEVEHRAKVVRSTDMISDARAMAEAEIAKIQEELNRKIAALKELK